MALNKLYDERVALIKKMQNFLDERTNEGHLSAEDDAIYAKMEADLNGLESTIERQKRIDDLSAKLNEPINAAIVDRLTSKGQNDTKTAFRDFLKTGRISNVLGTTSANGTMIPVELANEIVKIVADTNVFRKISKVITASGDYKIPTLTGRATAAFVAENGAYGVTDPTLAGVTLDAYKLGCIVKVSEELLNDSAFDIEALLADDLGSAMALAEEEQMVGGDGTTEPHGILLAGTSGLTAAGTTAVTSDELIDLFYSVKAGYRANGSWLMSDATLSKVRKLKDSNNNYIFQPSMLAGVQDTILGKSVYTSSYMPALAASSKSIAFGDFGYYWIADRQGIEMQRLNELYAGNGQVGFKASKRVDSDLTIAEAVKYITQHA